MQELVANSELITRAGVVDVDSSILFMLVLYLVFFYLLNKILILPLRDVFEKRHALTAGAREEADKAVAAAEEKLAEYSEKVGAARREAMAKAKEIRAEGQRAEREMLEGVRTEAASEIAKGLAAIEAAGTKAEAELAATAEETGKRIAAQILGEHAATGGAA